MDPTQKPVIIISSKDEGFPVSAIVVLAIGGYMLIFVIALIIRKCIINKGGTCCPPWCTEVCMCQICCNGDPNEEGCLTKCAQASNCNVPNKRQCMDVICPSKEWCDNTFCCCMSQQPQGECCNCGANDLCNCGNCQNDCFDCKDCCNDCHCDCCAQPDSVNCCCIEIKLSGGAGNRPPPHGASMNQPGQFMNQGYNSQYGGGQLNQGYINQQPMGQSFNMSQMNPGQSFAGGQSFNRGQFNPGQSFNTNSGMSFNPNQSFNTGQSFYPGQSMNRGQSLNRGPGFNAAHFSAQQSNINNPVPT